ncbi:MAG: ribonuclease P protein component [Candidatus Andersenbacteria bacterium]|nr:ribonuclease P protein component [Candidatus Andersenbacteria bacterium]MBI3250761.1 ribonuclease P protein component [Candidatus Andersenbacteria bacterium]
MLPHSNRLHRQGDVRRTLREGRLIRGRSFVVRIAQRSDKEPTRAAVVVGKRVHALAVKRHMYQRWLREVCRDVIKEAPIGYDMVVVAQPSLARLTSLAEIMEEAQPLLKLLTSKK